MIFRVRGLTPQVVQPPGSAILVDHQILVELEGGEADGHLGDNAGCDGTQTLVQGQGRLLLYDLETDADKGQVGTLEVR